MLLNWLGQIRLVLKKFFKRAPERTLTWNGCDKTDINCTNYKNLFVNKSHIKQGKDFWNKNF